MSAPEIRTADGTVWTCRTVTRGGLALYAPQGVGRCPEFVMATEIELAEHDLAPADQVTGPLPAADAMCECGHDGVDHHHVGTACWAEMPRGRRADGTAGPVSLCECREFVPQVDGIDRLTAPVQVFQEPEPALCASVRDVLPCVLAEDHGGDVHRDVNGYEWPTAPSLKGRALLDALTVERAEAAHRRRLGLDLPEQTTTTPTGDPR